MSHSSYLGDGFRLLAFNEKALAELKNKKIAPESPYVVGGLLAVLCGLLSATIFLLSARMQPGGYPLWTTFNTPTLLVGGFILGFVVTLVAMIAWCGITHLIARAFGGKASLEEYARVFVALYAATVLIGIVLTLVRVIPVIGTIVSLAWYVYTAVALWFTIRETYRLSPGRAAAVVLIPLLIVLALAALIMSAVYVKSLGV